MKSVRLWTAIAAVAATALVSIIIKTRTVDAQPAQTAPAATQPMDHMMHGMMRAEVPAAMSPASDDPRQLVPLPAPMQEHMLASMRDNLQTLNTVVGDRS